NAMRLRYSDDFPDVKRLEAQIAKVKAAEAEESKKAAPAMHLAAGSRPAAGRDATRDVTQAQQRVEELRTQLKLTNRELENRSAAQQRILAAISNYENHLSQIPVRQQEM